MHFQRATFEEISPNLIVFDPNFFNAKKILLKYCETDQTTKV
jgi:serine/threonine protein kinase